jgi:hypothetical protein
VVVVTAGCTPVVQPPISLVLVRMEQRFTLADSDRLTYLQGCQKAVGLTAVLDVPKYCECTLEMFQMYISRKQFLDYMLTQPSAELHSISQVKLPPCQRLLLFARHVCDSRHHDPCGCTALMPC